MTTILHGNIRTNAYCFSAMLRSFWWNSMALLKCPISKCALPIWLYKFATTSSLKPSNETTLTQNQTCSSGGYNPRKLQYNACNAWGLITFTWQLERYKTFVCYKRELSAISFCKAAWPWASLKNTQIQILYATKVCYL